jgi:hypothetical protein
MLKNNHPIFDSCNDKKGFEMEKKQQFNRSYILTAVLGVLILQNLLMEDEFMAMVDAGMDQKEAPA